MRYTLSLSLASLIAATAVVRAEVPAVVTDIPPIHSLVAQVMGDLGTPVLMLDRGADPHDFQLRPSQARALTQAGLVVWTGPEMAPWMARALSAGAETAQLALLDVPGTHLQPFGAAAVQAHADHGEPARADADGHGRDHADHSDHAEHEGHDDHAEAEGHDGHAHDGADPHAWLDPHNAEVWLEVIAENLGRIDPANADAYAANAAAAAQSIETLEAEIAATLAPVKDRPFVTFHDAYGYFTGHFGLNQAGSIALGDAASPGAARLAELRGRASGTTWCVFPEANHDQKLAAQLVEATGTRLGPVLDPAGATLEPGPELYANLLRGLAGGLAACLGEG